MATVSLTRFESPQIDTAGHSLARLVATLRIVGWDIRSLDLDLGANRATVEVHRNDGRWLLLSADPLGRAHVERHHRTIALGRHSSARGSIPRSPQVHDEFLGRERCEGPRSALRWLCSYIAANPAPGRASLPASEVRAALAPLMQIEQPKEAA